MKVAVVKYNAGNIRSVDYALKRLGVEAVITADEAVLRAADKVIFPGVGEAETTMDLGIFDTDVKRFISQRREDKVPHMGWNTIARTNSGLFKGFTKEEFVYFVHSFYVPVNDCTAAVTDYIHPFSAALHKGNYYATQFHPEKSGSVGERILRNFLEL